MDTKNHQEALDGSKLVLLKLVLDKNLGRGRMIGVIRYGDIFVIYQ